MSIATAIANQTTPVEELGLRLVGRMIFHNGSCLELTGFEGGRLMTVTGPVSVEEASNAVLPEPGTIITMYGQEMVWLKPHVAQGKQLLSYVFVDGAVQRRLINSAASIVTLPERARESARTVELLLEQHHVMEQFKARLNAAANEWADDNDLCGRYDEFMEEQGFSGREQDYEAEITVTFRRTITGRSFDDASADLTSDDVAEWVSEVVMSGEWSVEEY